jgi:hypothetical protein
LADGVSCSYLPALSKITGSQFGNQSMTQSREIDAVGLKIKFFNQYGIIIREIKKHDCFFVVVL